MFVKNNPFQMGLSRNGATLSMPVIVKIQAFRVDFEEKQLIVRPSLSVRYFFRACFVLKERSIC
jgi:hypothetical protein